MRGPILPVEQQAGVKDRRAVPAKAGGVNNDGVTLVGGAVGIPLQELEGFGQVGLIISNSESAWTAQVRSAAKPTVVLIPISRHDTQTVAFRYAAGMLMEIFAGLTPQGSRNAPLLAGCLRVQDALPGEVRWRDRAAWRCLRLWPIGSPMIL